MRRWLRKERRRCTANQAPRWKTSFREAREGRRGSGRRQSRGKEKRRGDNRRDERRMAMIRRWEWWSVEEGRGGWEGDGGGGLRKDWKAPISLSTLGTLTLMGHYHLQPFQCNWHNVFTRRRGGGISYCTAEFRNRVWRSIHCLWVAVRYFANRYVLLYFISSLFRTRRNLWQFVGIWMSGSALVSTE